jgi:hypothetical protein
MTVKQSIFGEVGAQAGSQAPGVDLGILLGRLLFFDTVIVKSAGLREVPHLVRAFGKTGFRQLYDSGILKFSSEFTSIITDIARNGVRELPLGQFSFGVAQLQDREAILRRGLRELQGIPGVKNAERSSMEETLIDGLLRPASDHGAQIQAQIELDLRNNTPALKAAVVEQLRSKFGDSDRKLEVRVEEIRERIFRIVTNLPDGFGMSEREAHDLLQPSIAAVANLNQRIADMAAYSAITGFKDSEAPLLFGKLAGIIAPLNPEPIEEQFARVITIANVPDFVTGSRVDVDHLLRARESAECREFREWLSNLDGISDAQVADMVSGVRNEIASMIRSGPGKALRLALTTAVGLIPPIGLVAGPVAGVFDSFVVEKMFPTSGAFAFLTHTYPSLFVSP